MTISAGLVLYRRTSGLEVLIGHLGGPYWERKDARAWTFPKGICEDGEDAFAGARREFAEEIGQPPPDVDYTDLGEVKQRHKIVRLWAGEADLDVTSIESNLFDLEWPPRSGRTQQFPELDRAAWADLGEARAKLVASQVVFVDRLLEFV